MLAGSLRTVTVLGTTVPTLIVKFMFATGSGFSETIACLMVVRCSVEMFTLTFVLPDAGGVVAVVAPPPIAAPPVAAGGVVPCAVPVPDPAAGGVVDVPAAAPPLVVAPSCAVPAAGAA